METQAYFYGTGKRKTAIARVRLMPGEGTIIVNNLPYEERFPRLEHLRTIQQPLSLQKASADIILWLRWMAAAYQDRSGLFPMALPGL